MAMKPKQRRPAEPLREAEELRAGIEELIGEPVTSVDQLDLQEGLVRVNDLQALLDQVDARDSLKFVEKRAKRKASKRVVPQ